MIYAELFYFSSNNDSELQELEHVLNLTNVKFCFIHVFCLIRIICCLIFEGSSAAMILSHLSRTKPLDGSNYSTWVEEIRLLLGLAELYFALSKDYPTPPTEGDPDYQNKYMLYDLDKNKWEKSNKKCLMVIKHSIVDAVKGAITDCDTAKEYLERLKAQFVGSSKAYAYTLTRQFVNMRYDGSGIRGHIQKMSSIAAKLNSYFAAPLPDEFIVHIIMQSLPKEYETFHVNYNNSVRDKWSLDQLMAQCVQEEERLKARGEQARGDQVNLAHHQNKRKNYYFKPPFKKPGTGGHAGQSSGAPASPPKKPHGKGPAKPLPDFTDFPVDKNTCL